MKHVYVTDNDGKLLGKNILNDDEPLFKEFVLIPPPRYDFDNEIPMWNGAEWFVVHTEKGKELALSVLKEKRNKLLLETDWTQLPDAKITEETLANFRLYRQQLRDITETCQDLRAVNWPVLPVAVKI